MHTLLRALHCTAQLHGPHTKTAYCWYVHAPHLQVRQLCQGHGGCDGGVGAEAVVAMRRARLQRRQLLLQLLQVLLSALRC